MLNIMRFLLLPAALLLGCGDSVDYEHTPEGYRIVFHNHGSIPGLFSKADVLAMFDGAVDRAKLHLYKYGAEPEETEALARSVGNHSWDHFMFATQVSPTGYAAGSYSDRFRLLTVMFWGRAHADAVPPDAPPWTVHVWPGVPGYDYGVMPRPFPAYEHELGHEKFGPRFEHGWVPPIVNGRQLARHEIPDWSDWCPVR